jgi:hypothetical protein
MLLLNRRKIAGWEGGHQDGEIRSREGGLAPASTVNSFKASMKNKSKSPFLK